MLVLTYQQCYPKQLCIYAYVFILMEDLDSNEHPAVFLHLKKRRMGNLGACNGPLNILESWVAWQCFFLSLPHSFLVPAGVFRIDLCKGGSFTQRLKLGQYSDNPKSCSFQLCHGEIAVS